MNNAATYAAPTTPPFINKGLAPTFPPSAPAAPPLSEILFSYESIKKNVTVSRYL